MSLRSRRNQQGNALLLTLLALILSALAIAAKVHAQQIELKIKNGEIEATVLDQLRNAANNAIFENTVLIQRGQPFTKTFEGVTTTITPNGTSGELIWEPSPNQLAAMGYLPTGWSSTTDQTSILNNQPYRITFHRTPAGCVPVNCNIEGAVVLMGAIGDPGTGHSDALVIGPILTRMGAEGAVSLPATPGTLSGFEGKWSTPNPVPGNPPGVVGVRIGTTSSAYAGFVHMGDLRDPKLAGSFSAEGNLKIGGTSELNGEVTVNNAPINVTDGTSTTCTRITAGVITLTCTGRLNTKTGVFTEGATAGNLGIATNDPNTIDVTVGDLFVKGPAGGVVRFTGTGSIEASEDVKAGRALSGPKLQLTVPVAEGTPCNAGDVASLIGGGLATCPLGTYVAAVRYGANKAACTTEGGRAMDPATGEELLCRNGQWAIAAAFVSEMVAMGSMYVAHGDSVPMPSCRDTGTAPPEPKILLRPANEAIEPVLNRGVEIDPRYGRGLNGGYYVGGAWVLSLRNGDGIAILGNSAIAEVYCRYQ